MNNELVHNNHQGGLKKRSSTYTIVSIMEQLFNLKKKNKSTVVVTSDQSSAYDLLDHIILEKN